MRFTDTIGALDKVDSRIMLLSEVWDVPPFIDWAEDNRYIPPGTSPFYGQFNRNTAPQWIEPLNLLHPDSPYTKVSIQKGSQSLGTVSVAEPAIGAFIRYKLGSILYITSNKNIAKIRSSSAIDVMIDNSNLAHLIKPSSGRMKRKTADTTYYKECAGNIKLFITSYNSIGDLKSNSFALIIKDEWTEAPPELKRQGDIDGIIEARTLGMRIFKILEISTPGNKDTCRIYKSVAAGDMRMYFVPCPYCGEKQLLVMRHDSEDDYGLSFLREKDKATGVKVLIPETIKFTCKFCRKDIYESKKQWMLINGEWKPTMVSKNKKHASFKINALYSPTVFLSWERVCQALIDTDFGKDLLRYKDYVINYKGDAWSITHKATPWKEFKETADDYCYGEVPPGKIINVEGEEVYSGALILFGGVDPHKDRLELHVIGIGYKGELWSIDYQIFYGDTESIDSLCWGALRDFVYTHSYNILGKECVIALTAVDTRYNPRSGKIVRDEDSFEVSNIVHDFVACNSDRFIAVFGVKTFRTFGVIKENRINNPESFLKKNYMVAVDLLKDVVSVLVSERHKTNLIHFPKYYRNGNDIVEVPDEHFKQFLSERYEEIKPREYSYVKIYKRNEVWDTFIYALAASELRNIRTWSIEKWQAYYYELLVA